MLTWIRRLFKRNPDRYPEWRPDQTLTPENRSMVGLDGWDRNVITYRITDPIFYVAPNGDRVQVLPDGSEIRWSNGKAAHHLRPETLSFVGYREHG
ncbi:hypothetical protein PBI_MAMINIAINA_37 [Mycobacterium phage Maminiaina]|nr:hypothetical protein PBI_MAMINIAINA_37 [Mycobacterium phage Maminiaina]